MSRVDPFETFRRIRFEARIPLDVEKIQPRGYAEDAMSLWRELKRRDVFKVAVAYLVASWLIVQVVGVLTEPLSLPDSLDTVVVVLLAIGFPFALIIAWVYEVTPEGIKVTAAGFDDSRPAPRRPSERLTYVVIGLLVMAVGFTLLGNYILTPSSTESRAVANP